MAGRRLEREVAKDAVQNASRPVWVEETFLANEFVLVRQC